MEPIRCDVLVVGSGLAGCWAALRAAASGASVIIAEKGKVARSGKSSFSGATLLYPTSQDDLDLWAKELVERGEYVSDQDWVAVTLQEQESRIRDMADWGVAFERDKHGQLVRSVGMSHGVTRMALTGSRQMMEALKKKLIAEKVALLERTMITGLLTSDGCYPTRGSIVGAFGFSTTTGEPVTIMAGATVLATGGTGYFDLSADGIVQAFRAGAEVRGMEYAYSFNEQGLARRFPRVHLNTFARLGMVLVNSKGERFMERYQPELKEQVSRMDLGLAVVTEGLEGRGPVYADLTHVSAEAMSMLRTLPTTAFWVQALEKEGIDLSRQKVEYNVFSDFMTLVGGGLSTSIYGETTLAGLFAAGEAGGHPTQGTYSVGGMNLATCCVGGYRAGESAARYAREGPRHQVKREQVELLEEEAFLPLKRKRGITPAFLWQEFARFISPANRSIFRSRESLEAILSETGRWREMGSDLAADDIRSLVSANKAKNLSLCIELVFRASLEREETRGCNIRTDFPYRDDINWLKWVLMRREGDGISVSRLPLPIYRWAVRPARYEKLPRRLPLPRTEIREGEDDVS